MTHPQPHAADRPVRVLFVFASLAGGEDAREMCLLAQSLNPTRFRVDALVCGPLAGPTARVRDDLACVGIRLDTVACAMTEDDTTAYLARKFAGCEVIVISQTVTAIYPALDRLGHAPPIVERRLTPLAWSSGPQKRASRIVGASDRVTLEAAGMMGHRGAATLTIPPMVDMAAFRLICRNRVRVDLGLPQEALVIGLTGSAQEVSGLRAACEVRSIAPQVHFVLLDAPEFGIDDAADTSCRVDRRLAMLGLTEGFSSATQVIARSDILCAIDVLVCCDPVDDGYHVVAEAGAARLAVVQVKDQEGPEQCRAHLDQTSLSVPQGDEAALADAILRLVRDPALRLRLGAGLYAQVAANYATEVVVQQWEAMFDEVIAEAQAPPATLFNSFVQGGFECSTHRLRNGRRVDVIAATGHDRHAASDYAQLAGIGMRTLRDAARWPMIEAGPDRFDLSSFAEMAQASQQADVQVIWDLMHYGWPDDIDIWAPVFVDRFASYATRVARLWRELTDDVPFWCPVNEISFMSWAGGDVQYLNPFAEGRGFELKVQLARASIAAMQAMRDVDPRARFVQCEPLIAIHHAPDMAHTRHEAEGLHDAQFQAFDLLSGRLWPQIGGEASFLDIIGVNYYPNNQWLHGGPTIDVSHPAYRPLSDLLFEVHARYQRPVLVAETGCEDHRRASWFRYVTAEVARAARRGVPVEGICLYPILNHPGWDDDRACQNGLLTQEVVAGKRGVDPALLADVLEVVATEDRKKAAHLVRRWQPKAAQG